MVKLDFATASFLMIILNNIDLHFLKEIITETHSSYKNKQNGQRFSS
jgi:hypothetical protein